MTTRPKPKADMIAAVQLLSLEAADDKIHPQDRLRAAHYMEALIWAAGHPEPTVSQLLKTLLKTRGP